MKKLNQTAEVAALLAAIKNDPDDDTARLVLADWIDENMSDQHELAELYRGGAKTWLEELAEEYGGEYEYEDEEEDDDGNTVTFTNSHDEYAWLDYAYIVEEGRRCLEGKEAQWVGKYFNCGNIQGLADFLNTKANAEMFWTCLEIVTGVRSDKVRSGPWFSCAC